MTITQVDVKTGEISQREWTQDEMQEQQALIAAEAGQRQKDRIKDALANTDKDMARIAEDIIGLLISKGMIAEADLPASVKQKLTERDNLRKSLK